MAIERTLVLVKPDGVQRRLVGEILQRFERTGLKIIALKMLTPTREQAELHYTFEGLIQTAKMQLTIKPPVG